MKDLLAVKNHTYTIEPGSIDSEFVKIFDRTPEHTIVFHNMDDIKKFPEIENFFNMSIDFFEKHSISLSSRLEKMVYIRNPNLTVTLYGHEALLYIWCGGENANVGLGLTTKNFRKLLNNRSISVQWAFTNNSQFAKEVYTPLFENFTMIKRADNNDAFFHIIEADDRGNMYLNDIKIKIQDDIDLSLNYNDDFIEVHENIMDSLNDQETGLILLHGGVGTGKTSYIRKIIRDLTSSKKKVIYMPPNMADSISSPTFISFLVENRNSIIIIEDAENILKTREAHGNSSVANILNATDGLLGDALKLQFICTFNADRSEIDPALFRKGRLLQEYEFKNLTVEKARKLWESLGHPTEDFPGKNMPLCDIFNYGKRVEVVKEKNQVTFGFVPQ